MRRIRVALGGIDEDAVLVSHADRLGLPPEQTSDDGAEELVWGTSGLVRRLRLVRGVPAALRSPACKYQSSSESHKGRMMLSA